MDLNSELTGNLSRLMSVLLLSVGLWKLFPKCGVRRKWALVPFARFYKLAECADREEDGLACIFCTALMYVLSGVSYLMETLGGEELAQLVKAADIAVVAVALMELVYHIRLYAGLCETFGRKKIWILLWLYADWITALIWGFSGKFQPVVSLVSKAPGLSGRNEEESSEGLVVDIKKRTAGSIFKRKTLLRDIHFTLKPGTMVLLLGGSGSGKTTLVNAVTGYEKANAKITLNGVDVYKHFNSMKYTIGFVPQQETVRNNDTVFRTVADNALLRLPDSYDVRAVEKKVDEVLESFGLLGAKHNLVAKQSGGMKKRISISMEYISEPFLFVLDEPDSGLDGVMARALMQKLRDISREGRIVVVITHTPDRVSDLFDEVIVLARDSRRTGRLAYHGSIEGAKTFFERDTMEEIVRVINHRDEGGEGRADEIITRYEEERNADNG